MWAKFRYLETNPRMLKSPATPPLDGLLDLACRDGVDVRPTLLRVLTDLYVQKPAHTAYEETQYVELALGLIRTVDEPTRNAVATSLRNYAGAPKAVLEALTGNAALPPPPPPAEPENDLADLFFSATSNERRLILANLDVVSTARFRALAPVHEAVAKLELAAFQRDPARFSETLARDLGLKRDLAHRIAHDDSGESIVVMAKAIGMKAAVLQRILLFLNPVIGRSSQRVYDLANLFEELSSQAASHMLATWCGTTTRKPVAHAPALYDDERRRARPATPVARSEGRPAQPATTTVRRG